MEKTWRLWKFHLLSHVYIFRHRKHCALVDGKPIKLIKIPARRISWHVVPGRQVRRLIRLSAWCAAWSAWSPGAPPDAWSSAKSPALDNNLKHFHQTIIESIVHSCIALFRINMHELFILYWHYFLINLIKFLIKTPLIYLNNIIIIILFYIFWTLFIICYIKTTNTRSSKLCLTLLSI